MKLNQFYLPKMVITLYKNESNYHETYYLESRDIIQNKEGENTLGAKMPFDDDKLRSLGSYLQEEHLTAINFKSLIPQNVLSFNNERGNERIIWFEPSCERLVYFGKALHLEKRIYRVPSLLFVGTKNGLSVYATKTKSLPNLDTKLYRAPLFNVSNSGKVCLGNAKVIHKKPEYFEQILENFQAQFWKSEFNATHGNPIKGNLTSFYRNQVPSMKFDNSILIKSDNSLKNILQ